MQNKLHTADSGPKLSPTVNVRNYTKNQDSKIRGVPVGLGSGQYDLFVALFTYYLT
jgi:hypothetical protein